MPLQPRRRSARGTLTAWYSVLTVGGIALFALSVYFFLEHLQTRAQRDMLLEETDWIHQIVDVDRRARQPGTPIEVLSTDVEQGIDEHFRGNPRNYMVVLETARGQVLYRSGKYLEGVAALLPAEGDTTVVETVDRPGVGRHLVAIRRAEPFVILVGFPDAVGREVLPRLLGTFLLLTPVVLFLAVAGGWFLTGIVLSPLRRITQTAQRITAENLGERIPPRDVHDEFGELIATMNTMIERLEGSFTQMRRFLMDVAHELRTPLTIMKGESELALALPRLPEEARDAFHAQLRETVRMARIVDDLLLLAKAEAGQLVLERQNVRMDLLLQDLREDAQILAADRGHTIDLGANPRADVPGDASRLRQLFRILLTNAVQYTDPGGTIRLESTRDAVEVRVAVTDTGIGIAPGDLPHVFERFYRTDDARARSHGGSGLGLAIARTIAKAHGGSITAASTPGKGSCFTVHLPVAAGPDAPPA